MADYPANGHGGVDFPAPLDPDAAGSGSIYLFDFAAALGAASISAIAVSAETGLTVASSAFGTAVESSTWPDTWTFTETASAAKVVQVRLTAAASARAGSRYGVTVTITDSSSAQHVRTGRVLVADR